VKKEKKREYSDNRKSHLTYKCLPNPEHIIEAQHSWDILRKDRDFYHFQRICITKDVLE